ncbi:glutathione S-transferase family protein [Sphingomonas qilianensis]
MLELFAHPFSSYCQKVLIAFYENDTPFAYRMLGADQPRNSAEFARAWPLGKFPVLLDSGHAVMESSIIIEHLHLRHPGAVRFLPLDADAALQVRMLDRIFDHHVMYQVQRVVNDALRPAARRDVIEVEEAKAALERAYIWLDAHLAGREWAAGGFGLADCAAAPALFYADWVHPIDPAHVNLRAYRARLLTRPSFARAVEEARPYRSYFPLGAPDRD